MTTSRINVFAVLAFVLVCCNPTAADDKGKVLSSLNEAELLEAKMLSHGESLLSGSFQGSSRYYIRLKTGEIIDERNSKFTMVFDSKEECIRFDYAQKGDQDFSTQYIETPDGCFLYSPETMYLILKPPVSRKSDRPNTYFNVRCLAGAIQYNELDRPLSEFRKVWKDVPKELSVKPSGKPDRQILLKTSHKGIVFTEFTLDSAQAMTPIATKVRGKTKEGTMGPVLVATLISWEKKGDVMVPKSARFEGYLSDGMLKVREMKFDWTLVNKDIDYSFFSFDALEPAVGTKVVDATSGEPLLIKTITAKDAGIKRDPAH